MYPSCYRHHTYENFALSKLAIIVVVLPNLTYFIETRSQSQKPPHKDP
ncbi:hypothetical protein HMPREF0539_1937, partial [Lacticaseibacillus rhamnosus LMS2-1]